MGRPPLNPRGGDAVRIETRIEDGDHDRLVELARKKGLKHPEMIRELMKWALDRAEALEREQADTGPLTSG